MLFIGRQRPDKRATPGSLVNVSVGRRCVMRLSSLGSGLSLAAVLLFSSTVFAQHHQASAPSSPPPSSSPSAAPSPAPAPAPAPAPSAPPSVSFSHSEASAPVSARAPESHLESGGSAGSHGSG